MSIATLDGKPIEFEAACREAARLLSASAFPLVAGMGADVAGARAAILLAERLRGAFDHLASREILADLDVMRSFSMFTTTPNEARVRADCLLFVGPGLSTLWPEMIDRLAPGAPPRHGSQAGEPRRVFWLGPAAGEAADIAATVIPATLEALPEALAILRASAGGRPVACDAARLEPLAEVATALKAAHFGVVVWSASTDVDPLAIEMLQALVADLNATTRCTGVPIGARAGAAGVAQTSGWMTGFPPRTGFGRGYPEHDPWRFEARRLVESGETDLVMWISAHDGEAPPWSGCDVPLITLAPAGKAPSRGLFIEVGRPGVDHDSVELSQTIGGFAFAAARAPSSAPAVAAVIDAITKELTGEVSC
jgi:formylmethanofuran dehydrogenase subunit B